MNIVPIQNYEQTFTFFVNNEEFHTSRLVTDLLSSKISNYHQIDPTINKYIINTNLTGDFNKILGLTNFKHIEIETQEFLLFIGIIETIQFNILKKDEVLVQNYIKDM